MNPYANVQPFDGNAISERYDKGRRQRKEYEAENALAKYAQNPQDEKARAAMAKWAPEKLMDFQQQQRREAMAGLESRREEIGMAAKIVGAIKPQDQAGWDQALQIAQQYGLDLSNVPKQFDPAHVQRIIQIDQALNPQKNDTPSAVREYEYRQRLPEAERGNYDRFRQSTRPQIFGSPESGYNIYDPNQGAPQAQPQRVPSKEAYDALPPGTQYIAPDGSLRVKGGQTGSAPSGGFPGY